MFVFEIKDVNPVQTHGFSKTESHTKSVLFDNYTFIVDFEPTF